MVAMQVPMCMSVSLAAFWLQPAGSGFKGHRELTMEFTTNQMLMLAMQLQPRMTPKCSRAVCSQHKIGCYMLQGLQWVAAVQYMSAKVPQQVPGHNHSWAAASCRQLTGRLVTQACSRLAFWPLTQLHERLPGRVLTSR